MLKDTELRLSFWRDGSTKAERLAAAVLQLLGYEEINPQSPLGGPDGKKDLICIKGGISWIGAVYFPIGPVKFTAVKHKFQSDLKGVSEAASGFIFITNQNLSPGQRDLLEKIACKKTNYAGIIHLQRIQVSLDSPSGYGARIQYLGIEMSPEEQLSWIVDSDSQTAKALSANTRELLALRSTVDRIKVDQGDIMRTLVQGIPISIPSPDLISESSFSKKDKFAEFSSNLTPEAILFLHRLVCYDMPSRTVGQLRTVQVWIGHSLREKAIQPEPPPADDVAHLLQSLCDEWRAGYGRWRDEHGKLSAIAHFHIRFLQIHPFIDGNGRFARTLLMQQCIDLFNRADMSLMSKGSDYYLALQQASLGNLEPLIFLLKPIVSG